MPVALRRTVEHRLGGRVVRWWSQDGGYSPGLAAVLETEAGERVFVKAVGADGGSTQQLYREEARRAALLPDGVPTPALRWAQAVPDVPGGPWEVLAFDAGAGRPPRTPWDSAELDAVVRLSQRIAGHDVAPGVLPEAADELPAVDWDELAQHPGLAGVDPWLVARTDRLRALAVDAPQAVRGGSLVHGDLRGDNTLVSRGPDGLEAVAVDWPYAVRGAAFVDAVGLAPAVRLEGGPEPEDLLARAACGADPDAVTSFLALLTGYFVGASLQPPPPGIPHLRAFQRAQGEVCVRWLRRRLGAR
ncbi:phosphotransferase [Xylanimonas oleitrophica]|uniref:phosphotransferase n=1 Tax=Xylanimonas oleitrophica TaxID=2607479 RepID=UPI0015D06106|nr:phosphotransferase [Xylanimonas oleitrophica]